VESPKLRRFLSGTGALLAALLAVMLAVTAGAEWAAYLAPLASLALGVFMWGHVYGWPWMAALGLVLLLAILVTALD
jgi:hypothetical protein